MVFDGWLDPATDFDSVLAAGAACEVDASTFAQQTHLPLNQLFKPIAAARRS
jgi:hypothetical protein